MFKFFLEKDLNYYYDGDINTDNGNINQQDLGILNLFEINHSTKIEKIFVSLSEVLDEFIKLGETFYNNTNNKCSYRDSYVENCQTLETWINENESNIRKNINYSGMFTIDLFHNIKNQDWIIDKCEKLYIVNYIYSYYKNNKFLTFYNKMKKLIFDNTDITEYISEILKFYDDEDMNLEKFYIDICNKDNFKSIEKKDDFYAQLLLYILILYFDFNVSNVKVCHPIYIHQQLTYHYYCSTDSLYDLAAYQLLLNLTSPSGSSNVKPCLNKKCHNLVEIKGNTKYCKKCRDSGIAKKLADKAYNESKKGKETRKKHYENKKNKQ